MLENTGQKKN